MVGLWITNLGRWYLSEGKGTVGKGEAGFMYIKIEKVKFKVFNFICVNCKSKFKRKVYTRIRKNVKLCDNCNKGKLWRKKHPDYGKNWRKETAASSLNK